MQVNISAQKEGRTVVRVHGYWQPIDHTMDMLLYNPAWES